MTRYTPWQEAPPATREWGSAAYRPAPADAYGLAPVEDSLVDPAAWLTAETGTLSRMPRAGRMDPDYAYVGEWPTAGGTPLQRGWMEFGDPPYPPHPSRFFYESAANPVSILSAYGQEIQVSASYFAGAHPAFTSAPPWATLVQFEGEAEPLPLTLQGQRGAAGVGSPRLTFHVSGSVGWELWRAEPRAADNPAVGAYNRGASGVTVGVLAANAGWFSSWEQVATGPGSGDAVDVPLASGDDRWRMYRVALDRASITSPGQRVDVSTVEATVEVAWLPWRWAGPDTGVWELRQAQNVSGVRGGWPLRARQNGGASGAWPLRAR